MSKVRFAVATLALLGAPGAWANDHVAGSAEASDYFGAAVAVGDFDCDDTMDLAVLVSGEDSGQPAVVIVYDGGDDSQLWQTSGTSSSAGPLGTTNDVFGGALAVGDFDGDECADLAVGLPYEGVGTADEAGVVYVLWGDEDRSITSSAFTQDTAGMPGTAEQGDHFGWALAAGDFDGDGLADLAIGVPGEDSSTLTDYGVVDVMYGDSGRSGGAMEQWDQDKTGIKGTAETDDHFGYALAAGNFNGGPDGYDDLAIGAPYEDVKSGADAGCVNVLYGGTGGLDDSGNQLLYEGHDGVSGTAQANDWFGYALAAGDFDGDTVQDLAVGIPGKNSQAGKVYVVYGVMSSMLDPSVHQQTWSQGKSGLRGKSESGDEFGAVLAAGHLTDHEGANGDPVDDLVVSAPFESADGFTNNGAVSVIYGADGGGGLSSTGNQIWLGDDGGGVEASYQNFGRALAVGDLDDDDPLDLVVGVPFQDESGSTEAGEVHVFFSDDDEIASSDSQIWYQGAALP